MQTVDQAFEKVSERVSRLSPVNVPLSEALGLVLSEDVVSDVDSPPHDKAMMDGYAVVADDVSQVRSVIEEITAGVVPEQIVRMGEASRIMTGSPVPEGATGVIPVEQTESVGDTQVRFGSLPISDGKHIMPQATLLAKGATVLPRGTIVRPIEVGILAEVGCASVPVYPPPTVAILATGDELTAVDQVPGPGMIRNSNGPILRSCAQAYGAKPMELPVGRDDPEQLRALVAEGLDANILLVTGGVSAGVKDLVPSVLASAGVEQVFHKVALKPGKPIWFGCSISVDGHPTLVFGLPGNPVSSLVGFHLFVRPAIEVMRGRAAKMELPTIWGELAEDFEHKSDRETFRPAYYQHNSERGELEITFPEWKGSADLAGLAHANCLARLANEARTYRAGERVELVPLHLP